MQNPIKYKLWNHGGKALFMFWFRLSWTVKQAFRTIINKPHKHFIRVLTWREILDYGGLFKRHKPQQKGAGKA